MPGRDSQIFSAAIALASLNPDEVFRRLACGARDLTDASFAALAVLDARGDFEAFIADGDDAGAEAVVRTLHHGHPALEPMRKRAPLVLLGADAPDGLEAFLGISVRVRSRVFGHLYLANSPTGFAGPAPDAVRTLVEAAGPAIDNALTYQAAQDRQRWLAAGQDILTMMLSGADEEEALVTIAARAREVADAVACLLVLPSVGGRLVIEIADGEGSEELIGTIMPGDGRSNTVLAEGIGMIVDSFSQTLTLRVASLRRYGPALYAPLRTSGRGVGVMMLLRDDGDPNFSLDDLTTAESFASQAALALVLAEARQAGNLNQLLAERERIARDLHDLAIQQLFATGMQLDNARRQVRSGLEAGQLDRVLSLALDNIDASVRQIRSIVHDLRDPDADVGLAERLRREASLARTGLGFAPSLVILVDGRAIDAPGSDPRLSQQLDDLVPGDLADDIVAVAREGLSNAARHAMASSVQVRVSARTQTGSGHGRLTVEVSDDGKGMPPVQHRRSGLENLSTRARRHRGEFTLTSNPDEAGTVLSWRVPLPEPARVSPSPLPQDGQ